MTGQTSTCCSPSADKGGQARSAFLSIGRRGYFLIAAAIIVTGLAFNWGWLVAVGAAPFLLALAPCAVMCGLGLCMKGGHKTSASEVASPTVAGDRGDAAAELPGTAATRSAPRSSP